MNIEDDFSSLFAKKQFSSIEELMKKEKMQRIESLSVFFDSGNKKKKIGTLALYKEEKTPAHTQNAEQWEASFFLPAPKKREITLEPPIPNRFANAVRNIKTGIASVAATTSDGFPSGQ